LKGPLHGRVRKKEGREGKEGKGKEMKRGKGRIITCPSSFFKNRTMMKVRTLTCLRVPITDFVAQSAYLLDKKLIFFTLAYNTMTSHGCA
jgi:hypothetical protein